MLLNILNNRREFKLTRKPNYVFMSTVRIMESGIILCMRSANEKWGHTVTPSLIGCAHTQNDPY